MLIRRVIKASTLTLWLASTVCHADILIVMPSPGPANFVDGIQVRESPAPEESGRLNEIGQAQIGDFVNGLLPYKATPWPFPTAAVPNVRALPGAYILRGRLVDYQPNPRRASWTDPASHDSILFLPYNLSNGGNPASPGRISTLWIHTLIHEYDGPEDFVAAFSDLHDQAGVPFGSAPHRRLLYALFDPKNETGLIAGNGAPTRVSPRQPGRITKFILDGPPSQESVVSSGGWDRHAPDRLSYMANNSTRLDSGGAGVVGTVGGIHQIVLAAARAKKYPQFVAGLYEQSLDALGILCSFALAEPGLVVAEQDRARTRRANGIGIGCLNEIEWVIREQSEIHMASAWGDEGMNLVPASMTFPLLMEDLASVALDVMMQEEIFTLYLGAPEEIPVDEFSGQAGFERVFHDYHDYPRGHIGDLIDIAAGNRSWASKQLADKASGVLKHLISPERMSHFTDAAYFEVERRYFQHDVWQFAVADSKWSDVSPEYPERQREAEMSIRRQQWGLDFFCTNGWGRPEDRIEFARNVLNLVHENGWRKYRLADDANDEYALRGQTSTVEQAYQRWLLAKLLVTSPVERRDDGTLPRWLDNEMQTMIENASDDMRPYIIAEFEMSRDSVSSCAAPFNRSASADQNSTSTT